MSGRLISTDSEMSNNITQHTSLLALIPGSRDFMKDIDLTGLGPEQKAAIMSILEGKNILLTGPAGTGKSHTIMRLKQIYAAKGFTIGLTATTGRAAIDIEGQTIHSWAGIGICQSKETALGQVNQRKPPQERIRSTSLLIIDEISMLSANTLDILDHVFRCVRGQDRPFGGMQIILCGDFFQLEPVKAKEGFAFQSPLWDTLIHRTHELQTIYRQSDLAMCTALNKVRTGEVDEQTMRLFESRIGVEFTGPIKPTELFPVNDSVRRFNEDELWKLVNPANKVIQLDSTDDLLENPKPRYATDDATKIRYLETLNDQCVAVNKLQLCIGAQVMLIKNLNVAAGLANGSRGVVVGFGTNNKPRVQFLCGITMEMDPMTWYMRVSECGKIRRTQYPLILAFAMSIHKSQGCSLDMVRVDLGGQVFGEGMSYVALSRARTLEGLSIRSINWKRVMTSQAAKAFYAKQRALHHSSH